MSNHRTLPALRWWIGGLLFLSTVINYIDRQTLSVLAPFLKRDYHWTNEDFALVVIAFRIAYAVGQSLSGRFLDRIGTRTGLSITVFWYSIAAMLTSLATGLRSFCVFRFLLGAGESANWPGATKAVAEWFPKRERGLAVALFDSGSSIGGGIAPFMVLWLYHTFGGWQPAFIITGTLGFLWLIAWRLLYHSPENHPRIRKPEQDMILKEKADPPPYFMAYEATDQENWVVSASLGALKANTADHSRYLDVTVRAGSPKLDNYHRIQGERPRFTSRMPIPIEDNRAAIQRRAWLETDRVYRLAAETLIKIRTNRQVKVAEEDDSDDFSQEEPAVFSQAVPALGFSPDQWAERVKKWSAEFAKTRSILTSHVTAVAQRQVKTLVNTEGTRIQHGRGFAEIIITARAKAADGMDLAIGENLTAADPSGLPKDSEVVAAIGRVTKDLTALLRAPVVDPYVGPAILSGRAAAVLFHEIFGHRIEGHRQKDEAEGQTFTKRVGAKVLPDFLSVTFDPTRRKFDNVDLNGWYQYDDEGVKAQRVGVVENGVLKTFLMSRSPVRGFPHSNGHGRRQPGAEVVSRQSNLLVESSQQVSDARLRQMLVEEIRKQNKPYGLYFREVTGGFTTTGRQGLQAFKVIPVIVYKVYPDGRPDELVRGADIVGTPLASFEKIVATSDRPEVFNGYCGAESGSVPVSAVSPAILVSQIEIQKKERSLDRPPLLPMPLPDGGAQ